MKTKLFLIAGSIALLAVCSCSTRSGSKKDQKPAEGKINPKVKELDETPDNGKLVYLLDFGNDSMTVKDEKGDAKTYGYGEAKNKGNVKGSLKKGDLFSVCPIESKKQIAIAINVTELKGQWFYDMKQFRGLSFDEKGGMTSINSDKVCFRQWKLLNGKLYIYYADMQQQVGSRNELLVEEATIKHLSSDKLTLCFLDETMECKHQLEPVKFGN